MWFEHVDILVLKRDLRVFGWGFNNNILIWKTIFSLQYGCY